MPKWMHKKKGNPHKLSSMAGNQMLDKTIEKSMPHIPARKYKQKYLRKNVPGPEPQPAKKQGTVFDHIGKM